MASHTKLELEKVVSDAQTESPASEEELRKKLRWSIKEKDEDSFHSHLSGLAELLQDDNKMKELLDGSLAYAAFTGFQPAVKTLIQKGADVNVRSAMPEDSEDSDGKGTPVHWAARGGHIDTVTFFLEQGGHVNIKNEYGRTPLHLAAEGGHVDIVRYLVDKGADTNIKEDRFGYAPLHLAAEGGHVDTVGYLVDKGADTNIKNDWFKHTPLHLAALGGRVDTVRCLVDKGADTSIKDGSGQSPLHLAALGGYVDTVRCLADRGADTNIKDGIHGSTPLHFATEKGHVDTVRCLVDKGADVNIKDSLGATPLHEACREGHVETVEYLLEKRADPTAKEKYGETPLSRAIRSRHKDVAALLLEQEKWEEMLKCSDRESTTPMRGLIVFMPDVAERAFSKCVKTNKGEDWGKKVHADSRKLKVRFNYEFLEDFQEEQSSDKQSSDEEGGANIDTSTKSWQPKKFAKYSHPLFLIKKHGHSNLKKHPLVISLLDYKWTKFGRYIFFVNLFIYLIFLMFLTAFGLVVLSPVERPCIEVLNGSFNGTIPEDCGDLTIDEYRFLFVGATFTIATALLRLAMEVIQLCRHPMEYLQDWVNWLEIPLYLCSIIFTFVFATPCVCVYNWQWQMGVVAVFLGWIGLISYLQKWPVTGIYVLMFINIIRSFLKIAFLALLLVIAFALAFYMLFFEPDEMRNAFSHPGRAIVKVMTMTTGELDYDEIFHQQEGEEEIAFPPVSFILWIVFLVLIPVLLSNLLVGLAVGDVKELQETASENRIELQIDLVLTIEELLEFMHLRHRFVIKESEDLYPNAVETLLPNWLKGSKYYPAMSEDKYEWSDKVRRWIAKRYVKWAISDDYSASGVNICDRIKEPQYSKRQLLQLHKEELAKLKQQGEQKVMLQQQSEEQRKHEAKLQQQLSEEQAQKLEEQSKEMKEKTGQLQVKLQQDFQEAINQLSQQSEEHAAEMKEQAAEVKEQVAQLAGEVATLREALQKLITKMDV